MYTVKNTEKNNEKASNYETFSMLYLWGVRQDKEKIDLILVDCFNDLTGATKDATTLWDVQSKGHKTNTARKVGEHLFTLYENYTSSFPFKHLILFLEAINDKDLIKTGEEAFTISNITNQAQLQIHLGLKKEIARRHQKNLEDVDKASVDAFLQRVEFVVCSNDKALSVKNLVGFRNKDLKTAVFYTTIFDEIRAKQSALKNRNIESTVLSKPADALNLARHISRNETLALLVNRLVGSDLFKHTGIPPSFLPYVKHLEPDEAKDLALDCTASICRTFFNKNNKSHVWRLLEHLMKNFLDNPEASVEDTAKTVPEKILSKIPTIGQESLRFLISQVKEGLE